MICKKRPSVKIKYQVFSSVEQLNKAAWDNIASDNLFLQTRYLFAVEKSGLGGMSYRYITIGTDSSLKAICYFQLADLSSKDLGSFLNLENYGPILQTAGEKINNMLLSTSRYRKNILLVCGSLLISGNHGVAVAKDFSLEELFKHLPSIADQLEEEQKNEGNRIVGISVKDFYDEEASIENHLEDKNYHRMLIDPNMIVDIKKGWHSFDDYLASLSAKYRLRANNALKKLENISVKYLSYKELEESSAEIEALYLHVQKKAPVRIVRAGIQYFLFLKKNLPDQFVIRAFYLDEKMIAFTSGFKNHHHYEAHFIGINYHYNSSHAVYINILYDFINEAIRNKAQQLIYGRTALEIKSTVGARPYQLTSFFRLSNGVLNKLISPFISSSPKNDWVQRDPFKETQNSSALIQ